MLEDRLDLEPELLLRERDQPGGLGHGPFLPGTAVQPHLGPPAARRDEIAERALDRLLAHPVGTVWIGQVAGDEDEVGRHLFEQRPHDGDVRGADRRLLDRPGLVERQVEETRGAIVEPEGPDSRHRFSFPDQPLDLLHLGEVHLARLFPRQKLVHPPRQVAHRRLRQVPLRRQPPREVEVAAHVVIEHGEAPAGHVGHGDLVVVFHQLPEDPAHRDHVVVGMR